ISLTATAIAYEDNQALARIAERLGEAEDAKRYRTAAEAIKAAFNRKFFDPAASVYAQGSQTAQAIPLVLGLVPEEHRERVLDALVRDVQAHGKATTAGDAGYRHGLRPLAEGGRSDVVFSRNRPSANPGFGSTPP